MSQREENGFQEGGLTEGEIGGGGGGACDIFLQMDVLGCLPFTWKKPGNSSWKIKWPASFHLENF